MLFVVLQDAEAVPAAQVVPFCQGQVFLDHFRHHFWLHLLNDPDNVCGIGECFQVMNVKRKEAGAFSVSNPGGHTAAGKNAPAESIGRVLNQDQECVVPSGLRVKGV